MSKVFLLQMLSVRSWAMCHKHMKMDHKNRILPPAEREDLGTRLDHSFPHTLLHIAQDSQPRSDTHDGQNLLFT